MVVLTVLSPSLTPSTNTKRSLANSNSRRQTSHFGKDPPTSSSVPQTNSPLYRRGWKPRLNKTSSSRTVKAPSGPMQREKTLSSFKAPSGSKVAAASGKGRVSLTLPLISPWSRVAPLDKTTATTVPSTFGPIYKPTPTPTLKRTKLTSRI